MSKLNVFIDGTWLFSQCGGGRCLANTTAEPERRFDIDFNKLNKSLLGHIQKHDQNCTSIGHAFLVTSVFTLPEDFDTWPEIYSDYDFTAETIEKNRRNVYARDAFAQQALQVGYSPETVYRPKIKPYIITKLVEGRYQEKQVDTTVVALLVKMAITQPADYHAIITGDSDILPAIKIAYPEYTKNVMVCSTHPDELQAVHRQSAFSLFDFDLKIPSLFLQDVADQIIAGKYAYRCAECNKVFVLSSPLPKMARAYCFHHRQQKPPFQRY